MQRAAARLRDDAERERLGRDQRGGLVDERADRGDAAGADDVGAGDQRAEPVREVDDLLAGHAREEVLVAAGEADHLVREHRPDDERDVVLDHRAVQPDVDALAQQAAGQLGDPAAGDDAERDERRRVRPLVVADLHPRIARGQVAGRVAEVAGQLGLGHRRVGAERDQGGHAARPADERPVHGREQQRQRAAARRVGDDDADAPAVEVRRGELLGDEGA